MNRHLIGFVCAAFVGACVVNSPRPPDEVRNDTPDGGRHDSGSPNDGGDGADGGDIVDAGDVDAGAGDAGLADGGVTAYPRRWGNPVALTELNSTSNETIPSMSTDMLRVCFASDRNRAAQVEDIYCASRTSTDVPFDAPVIQASINSDKRDRYATIHGDDLYFSSDRAGSFDVYRAQWSAVAGAYGQPSPVSELNTSSREEPVSITSDGLTMFLESDRTGSLGLTDIWVSTRETTSSQWGTPVNITTLNTAAYYDWGMRIAPDDSFALFASACAIGQSGCCIWQVEPNPAGGWKTPVAADIRVPSTWVVWNVDMLASGDLIAEVTISGGDSNLYLIPQRGEDPPSKYQWGTPVAVTELNAAGMDGYATMTADGLRVCFNSDRSGGKGDYDIWCATRTSRSSPFNTPVNLSLVNSSSYDAYPGLSSDGAELFFFSHRNGNGGDIFRAVWVPADNTYEFPQQVPELSSSRTEGWVSFTGNDLVALFESDRLGPDSSGKSYDLFMAVRASRASAFGAPVPITALNTQYLDGAPAANPDGSIVVFTSGRPTVNETGDQKRRLWAAHHLGNNQFDTPELIAFENFANIDIGASTILWDGSLMFNSFDGSAGDIYIAPPK